ncbi:MAG: HAMP domain-containing sensor histidine kinase [Bdellovibrionales bacterium]|nr:HAMP domain-containing sensor histidine kinase [Bdellovibrionales bacterium]
MAEINDSTGLKPIRVSRRLSVKFALATVWLVFTLALASWWLIFGLRQLDEIRELGTSQAILQSTENAQAAQQIERQHRMLLSEGVVLLVMLLVGGSALLYNIRVESRRARQIAEFFASFTHDLKTSLASLRIQTESLQDELGTPQTDVQAKLLRRIMSDAGRLETQLENALYLADSDGGEGKSSVLLEPVSVRATVLNLEHLWPTLRFNVQGDASVLADRRAFESIVRNIAQNAVRHGQASELTIGFETYDGIVSIRFADNGKGFRGDVRRLGEIFARHTGMSGSGIGLYLVAKLIERMNGRAKVETLFMDGPRGFAIIVELTKADRGHETKRREAKA